MVMPIGRRFHDQGGGPTGARTAALVGVLDSGHRERFVDDPVKDAKGRGSDDCVGEQDPEWLADAVSVEVDRVSQEQIGVAGRQERAEIVSRTRGGREPRSLLPMRGCRTG